MNRNHTLRAALTLALLLVVAFAIASPAMAALSANKEVGYQIGSSRTYLVEDDVHIYRGALVCLNTSGYLLPAADTANYIFAGVAAQECDNTLTGHAQGGKSCQVFNTGDVKLVSAGLAQSNVGAPVYVTDDATVGLTATNYVWVGAISDYISATSARVRFAAQADIGVHVGVWNFAPVAGTWIPSAGVLGGAGTGTGASAETIATGSGVALGFNTRSTSVTASHSVSGLRWTMDYGTAATSPAPSGDVLRGRAYLVGDAAGSVALTGSSSTVELASTGASNTGMSVGGRSNIVLPNGVMTNAGTYYGSMAEVFLGGVATDTTAYTRIAPLGIVVGGSSPTAASQVANMVAIAIDVPSNMVTSDATMVCTGGAGDTCDAKLKMSINGTNYWMMLSTDDE